MIEKIEDVCYSCGHKREIYRNIGYVTANRATDSTRQISNTNRDELTPSQNDIVNYTLAASYGYPKY